MDLQDYYLVDCWVPKLVRGCNLIKTLRCSFSSISLFVAGPPCPGNSEL
jgi:hypothetical protein